MILRVHGEEADVERLARRLLRDELRLLVVRAEDEVVALLDERLRLREVLVPHRVHRLEVLRARVARIGDDLHRHHRHIVFRHCHYFSAPFSYFFVYYIIFPYDRTLWSSESIGSTYRLPAASSCPCCAKARQCGMP